MVTQQQYKQALVRSAGGGNIDSERVSLEGEIVVDLSPCCAKVFNLSLFPPPLPALTTRSYFRSLGQGHRAF